MAARDARGYVRAMSDTNFLREQLEAALRLRNMVDSGVSVMPTPQGVAQLPLDVQRKRLDEQIQTLGPKLQEAERARGS